MVSKLRTIQVVTKRSSELSILAAPPTSLTRSRGAVQYLYEDLAGSKAHNRGGKKIEDRLEESSPRPTASNGYKKSKNQFRGWSNEEIDTLYNLLAAGLRGNSNSPLNSWQKIADALNAAMAPALGADTGTLNPKTLIPNCR